MIRFIDTYRATALCLFACMLALTLFARGQFIDAAIIFAFFLLVTLGTFVLERSDIKRRAPATAAWKMRASYQLMVARCAIEYGHARACNYTRREARAYLRAHIHAAYPGLTTGERNMVMLEAIEYADAAPHAIKTVNAINQRAPI